MCFLVVIAHSGPHPSMMMILTLIVFPHVFAVGFRRLSAYTTSSLDGGNKIDICGGLVVCLADGIPIVGLTSLKTDRRQCPLWVIEPIGQFEVSG